MLVTAQAPGPAPVLHLVLRSQAAVRDVGGKVGVVDGAEGQAVGPAAAEVGDVNILQGKRETEREDRGWSWVPF